MRLPIRPVVCWIGGEKGIKNEAAPGYKLQKTNNAKTTPPEVKSEMSNLVGNQETKQKSMRDDKEQKNPSTRQLVGTHGTNGAAGGRERPNQSCSKASHLSPCYTRRNEVFSVSSASLFFRRTSPALSPFFLHLTINVRLPSITTFPTQHNCLLYTSPSPRDS